MSVMRKLLRRRGDDGIAIVAAMGVVMLVGILVVVTVAIAMSESTNTGRDRQRSSAIAQAESQLDVTVGQIQAAAPSALGSSVCGASSTTTSVGSDRFAISTTVAYFAADGTPVACDDVATTQVATASIKSAATSQKLANTSAAKRTMETLVQLTPNYRVNLDKAIFSQSNLTMANKTNLKSSSGTPNADIYTNGNFTCNNNEDFQGSIFAQGSVTFASQCTVAVDVRAGVNITVNNQSAAIGGQALATSGNIWLGKASLGQQARAGGTATSDMPQGPCHVAGKCFSSVSVGPVPHNDFPQLVWNGTAQTEWAAHGYTTVVNLPNADFPCGWYTGPNLVGADGHSTNLNGKADGVGAWLYANAYKLSGPTIVTVSPTCTTQVQLQGINISLNHNLVLMSAPGINFSGNTQITSVAGTATTANPNLLYLIQPYTFNGVAPTCSGDGISLNNQVSVDSTVNTLMYSPCSITKANQSTLTGQVYSGSQLNVNNQLDMTYSQLPVWGGLAGITNPTEIASYNAQTMYKREAQ